MSTRSLIGYKNEDGSVDVVYCHFDGNLNGVGAVLEQSYYNSELAKKLVSGGDMSYVDHDIAKTGYYSKRGESCPATRQESVEGYLSYADGVWHEWLYLWDGGRWLYSKVGSQGGYTAWRPVGQGLQPTKMS